MERCYSEKDEAFWRKMILPEEDRLASLVGTGWTGVGYRWFKSENVVCLEHYLRAPETNPAPHQKAS
jgi:hypothetical protein